MDTTTINGLHKCKVKNSPIEGEVKNMVVEHKPPRNGKKAWIKITNKKPEDGGTPYRILGVQKLDWPPDEHENIAFNIEVEASSSQPTAFNKAQSVMRESEGKLYTVVEPETIQQGKISNDEIDSTYDRIKSKGEHFHEPPPIVPEPPPKRFSMLDERQRAIIRQHSQSMSLEVLKLKVALNELTIEDLNPRNIKALADFFDQDVYKATE